MTLAILLITVITGFACTFATANENQRSTKLVFDAKEYLDLSPELPNIPNVPPSTIPILFGEGGVLQVKNFWSAHFLEGKIGVDTIMGYTIDIPAYTKSVFHAKISIDPITGLPDLSNMILNGQTWFYFTWGDLTGYFTGTINVKMVNGVLDGKFTLQGFEGFEGMKLFGTVYNVNPITNGLYGTILIPN